MKKICSWCKTDLEVIPDKYHAEHAVTHGICSSCLNRLFEPAHFNLTEFLDHLEATVIAVTPAATVISANKQARDFLHKEPKEFEHRLGGDVFECAYAKLPGGCGNTIHCDGCTIRNTVIDTFRSGKCHFRTPAYLIQGRPDANQKIEFLISTEKVMDVVLLEIAKV